jgi:hypothetical protein
LKKPVAETSELPKPALRPEVLGNRKGGNSTADEIRFGEGKAGSMEESPEISVKMRSAAETDESSKPTIHSEASVNRKSGNSKVDELRFRETKAGSVASPSFGASRGGIFEKLGAKGKKIEKWGGGRGERTKKGWKEGPRKGEKRGLKRGEERTKKGRRGLKRGEEEKKKHQEQRNLDAVRIRNRLILFLFSLQ